jgi:hypothetical protein
MIWQTRTLATFVAATVPVETKGDVSPLMDAALLIGVNDTAVVDSEDIPTQTQKVRVAEPNVGSYEAFMTSFGAPTRWAGR